MKSRRGSYVRLGASVGAPALAKHSFYESSSAVIQSLLMEPSGARCLERSVGFGARQTTFSCAYVLSCFRKEIVLAGFAAEAQVPMSMVDKTKLSPTVCAAVLQLGHETPICRLMRTATRKAQAVVYVFAGSDSRNAALTGALPEDHCDYVLTAVS